MSVSWSVTGGSGKYAVGVDSKTRSGSSAKVTCQATPGTQSVAAKTTDTTYKQLSATQTITLTVTRCSVEAPIELDVDADVTSLRLKRKGSDGVSGYGVRIDGGAETTLSHPFPGLTQSTKYKLEMTAYLNDDRSE